MRMGTIMICDRCGTKWSDGNHNWVRIKEELLFPLSYGTDPIPYPHGMELCEKCADLLYEVLRKHEFEFRVNVWL